MKICISGASGFIGGEIAEYLISQKHDVISIGRSNPKIEDLRHYTVDILNIDQSVVEEIGSCDAFVHCSFIMASSANVEDFNVLHDNIKLSEGIAKLALSLKVKSFVNLSSMAVYPNLDGTYSEKSIVDTSQNNDCLYGLSKICSENIFNHFLEKRQGIPVTHLRVSQVYGDKMRQDRTYFIMKDELARDNQISVWGNGERVSNFVSVRRVAKVVTYFVENTDFAGIYNLGGDNFSYAELAADIIKKYGTEKSKVILVDKGVKSKFYLNMDKLNTLITTNNIII